MSPAESDLSDLYQVFLNARLQRACMRAAPVGGDPIAFFHSDRGRFERTYVALLFTLVEGWNFLWRARRLVMEVAPELAPTQLVRKLRGSVELRSMAEVRAYMCHRDQREYWDAGRVGAVAPTGVDDPVGHEEIYEAFAAMFAPDVRRAIHEYVSGSTEV